MWTQQQFSKKGTRNILWLLAVLAVWGISGVSVGVAAAAAEQAHPQLISGDRILLGRVEGGFKFQVLRVIDDAGA